jgi:hypothetical protein
MTLLKRLPRRAEVATMTAPPAPDDTSAMTGAIANVTCDELVDSWFSGAAPVRRMREGAGDVIDHSVWRTRVWGRVVVVATITRG